MHTLSILLPLPFDQTFSYTHDEDLTEGTIVDVPFGRTTSTGVVWASSANQTYDGAIKSIDRVQDEVTLLSKDLMTFIEWVADYNAIPKGVVLKMCLPPVHKRKAKKSKDKINENPFISNGYQRPLFSDEQEEALKVIEKAGLKPVFLDGITGSGKTEVYMDVVANCIETGQQAMILLPEINLTTQWLDRFEKRFGFKPFQWHSQMTPAKKSQTWKDVAEGRGSVLVGARSGLFLPFHNLGIIVLDEEHDSSFKQEEKGCYHARDMAIVRAKIEQVPIILASATPSIETYHNVQEKRYAHAVLKKRHGSAVLPDIQIIDLKEHWDDSWLTKPLLASVQKTYEQGQQSMIFLNRRGYAAFSICRSCGHTLSCPGCHFSLVEHQKPSIHLLCHLCGFKTTKPDECPECHIAGHFLSKGPGVHKIEETLKAMLPDARIGVYSSDTLNTNSKLEKFYRDVSQGHIDILVGTQLLAKGHHFPKMTFVGVISADGGLSSGDLRACEKTFQLLQQVSGRAGRDEKKGLVLIQTFNPEHPAIQAIAKQDRDTFLNIELSQRGPWNMPPFGRLASLVISSFDLAQAQRISHNIVRYAQTMIKSMALEKDIDVMGPIAAPIAMLRGRHRWRILVKAKKNIHLAKLVKSWVASTKAPGSTKITIDIDPMSFM